MLRRERTLFYNGRIVTMDAADTHADAVLVAGDRIEAVGGADELRALGGIGRETDLAGGTLYPGFIDTHSHLDMFAAWSFYAYCGGTSTMAEALDILRKHADAQSDAPIIMGYGYDDTATADRRGPTAAELDAIFGDRPAILTHISIHAAYVNTAILNMLGIAPDRPHDHIDVVCENGRPTGLLTETMAMRALALLPPTTPQSLGAGLETAMRAYNAQGFTSTIGGGLGLSGLCGDVTLRVMGALELEGKMTVRCHLPFLDTGFEAALSCGLLAGPGSAYVRPHGIKLITDGSIQAFTAAIPEGYHARPDTRPEPIISQEDMDTAVFRAHAAGQQVVAHGNGNGAIERVILAVERAQARCPRADPHHLLIHCQTASDSQLARMKAAGLEPSFFVLHVWNWGDRHRDIFLGPERAARIDPCGSAVRLGLPFSLHADTPVLPQMTMRSIHAAVNRITSSGKILGPEQRVSPLEAMRAYTVYAAGMCLDAANRGSIEPGKLADFTLLDADPRTVAAESIKDIAILSTVSGGRPVWGSLV